MTVAASSRIGVIACVVASVLVTTGDTVVACSCTHVPVCGNDVLGGAADIVFVGTAIEVQYPATRFTVERVLVGDPVTELTLGPLAGRAAYENPRNVTSCDRGFTANQRYLVYASRHPDTGDFVTSGCSRTRPASDPQAGADIAYFDARAAGQSTDGWLSGVVSEQHYDSSRGPDGRERGWIVRPLSGIRITATAPDETVRSTITDATGVYIFHGLTRWQNATWRLRADLPAPFVSHDGSLTPQSHMPPPGVLWLRNSTCAEAHVAARVDGRIAGRVLDTGGRPARGIVMELANATALRTNEWASGDQRTVSDDEGRFEFRPVPEGQYYVGVELNRRGEGGTLDRRRYYPGVRDLTNARVVTLNRGERLRLEPFRLPPLPTDRILTVMLRAPSPEVAASTRVYLVGTTKELLNLQAGSLDLPLPYGATYSLMVDPAAGYFAAYERGPVGSAAPTRLGPDETDRLLTVTLHPVRR